MKGLVLVLAAGAFLRAQQVDFQQQGSVEYRGFGFPQTTYTDSGHVIGEALIRYDVLYGLGPRWKLSGGTETRSDTHRQTEREFRLNIDDRGLRRPNFSIRRVSLAYTRGRLTVEGGKQLIRWGKTDILNPTDRFAPRDYLTVVDADALAVFAARAQYETRSDSFEIVLQPFFTPSRMPLLNQRWTVLPKSVQDVAARDMASRIPGGTQWGARWKHAGNGYDVSMSFFDGRNHLPLVRLRPSFERFYPRMRMYGADAAVPAGWLTLKGEAAYFQSSTQEADEYALFVVQVGREAKRYSFSGGYAGEAITRARGQFRFAPDRGFARSFLSRGSYSIDARRGVRFESAAGANGLWLRPEYSENWGAHWKASVGFTLLRGEPTDFFGQYRRNSFFHLSLRYGF